MCFMKILALLYVSHTFFLSFNLFENIYIVIENSHDCRSQLQYASYLSKMDRTPPSRKRTRDNGAEIGRKK